MRQVFVCLSASLVAATITTLAAAAISAQPGATVSFSAAGPAGMRIAGTTSELTTADDGQSLTVIVALAHLTTGIELRDKHMREKYLETPTYPTAVLKIPRANVALPAPGASRSADATGTVTLHGQTRSAPFHYIVKHDDSGYHVDATLHVDMRDYGITVPSYLGVTVKPDVDVEVHFTASDS